ncbi:MAG TPA: hypothetical protein PKJ32_09925 [Piscinibacter sp.]|jgi:hypothetical protein|nr:MAG: hypothetical protein EKK65_11675 [Xanthomonadales bacterium]TXH62125.1 MAG: hypothetical protein E6Q93_03630 [Burkholderiaceae bacterium]HNW63309.1 hypothetical protein [Piscinibacter sp.]
MTRWTLALRLAVPFAVQLTAAALAAAAQAAPQAASLRDPMQPPVARQAPPGPVARPAAAASAPAPVVQHLYTVGNQRWVIQGGRKRGVGDLLGDARIERIEDSAVIVRQGGALVRVPLFAGVTKRPAASEPGATAASTASTPAPDTPSAAPAAAPTIRLPLAAASRTHRPHR